MTPAPRGEVRRGVSAASSTAASSPQTTPSASTRPGRCRARALGRAEDATAPPGARIRSSADRRRHAPAALAGSPLGSVAAGDLPRQEFANASWDRLTDRIAERITERVADQRQKKGVPFCRCSETLTAQNCSVILPTPKGEGSGGTRCRRTGLSCSPGSSRASSPRNGELSRDSGTGKRCACFSLRMPCGARRRPHRDERRWRLRPRVSGARRRWLRALPGGEPQHHSRRGIVERAKRRQLRANGCGLRRRRRRRRPDFEHRTQAGAWNRKPYLRDPRSHMQRPHRGAARPGKRKASG